MVAAAATILLQFARCQRVVVYQFARNGRVLEREFGVLLLGDLTALAMTDDALASRLHEEIDRHAREDDQDCDDGRTRGRVLILQWDHGCTLRESCCKLLQ